jgi:hypothetical protein
MGGTSLSGVNDGNSGGGGGGTYFISGDSGFDASQALLIAAGGGGGNDATYSRGAVTGPAGEVTSSGDGLSANGSFGGNSVAGYVTSASFKNGGGGAYYSRYGTTYGGFGGGMATDDAVSSGGGWQVIGIFLFFFYGDDMYFAGQGEHRHCEPDCICAFNAAVPSDDGCSINVEAAR